MPKIEPADEKLWFAGRLRIIPASSPSSLISCSLFEEADGDAVWSGKEYASEVSFRLSALVISSRVS